MYNMAFELHSLVFYLVVEMSSEPVVEGASLDVAGGAELELEPRQLTVVVHRHRDVVRLSHPHKPTRLEDPAIKARNCCVQNDTFATLTGLLSCILRSSGCRATLPLIFG